ncbi:MAG: hypothetical protein HGA96_14025 [Desulfobulbaceae bacterium]|nr:hypothetical protein [Desulfobulbaceae bacterium]
MDITNRIYLNVVLALLLLISSSTFVNAEDGPWKWQFSLNINKEKQGNQIRFPTGLFIDKERERYYVVDASNGALHSFDVLGGYLNTFKPGDQLQHPYDMVRDASDALWVIEKSRNSLTRIDLKEKKIDTHKLYFDRREIFPDRISLHDGNFYILDKMRGSLIKFNHELIALQEFCCSNGVGGFSDFVIKNDKIWTLDTVEKALYIYNFAGELQFKLDISASVSFPYAIDVDPDDQIFVLDRHDGSVAVFGFNGDLKYRFLKKGQSRGRLYYPEDIQFDFLGRLCVVDSGNGRVEIFSR